VAVPSMAVVQSHWQLRQCQSSLVQRQMALRGKDGFNNHSRSMSFMCMASSGGEKAKTGGKKKKGKDDANPYSKTVNLPVTSFDMRANSVVKEPQIQEFWSENRIYERLAIERDGEPYILHDGPPYANGDLHIGHALNKILKDFINRYQLLQGKKARYVPGWDTHGLPIELKVLQSMKNSERQNLTPVTLREKAKAFALETVDAQREQFKRYGIWADWDEPYVTLQPEYEAAQLKVFGKMVTNGHIYRGRKPVYWSPSSRTALAEAELEYPDGHVSRSIYVGLPVKQAGENCSDEMKAHMEGAMIAVWTTTPWTIPANLAVGVNDALEYAVVSVKPRGEDSLCKEGKMVVAKDLISVLEDKLKVDMSILCSFKGSEIEGTTYQHPLFDRVSPVVIGGDYITTDAGTGLVHTAPGHGQDDYLVGQKYGLPLLSPVNDAGVFTDEAGPFEGLQVQKEGTEAVIEALKAAGVLLCEEDYEHRYPYDWRTKKPTITRATDQWFASVEGFRSEALKAIKQVKWIPESGENRITAMTESRSDWCISRQRTWGVPIPVFYDVDSGEPLMNEETINHIISIVEKEGTDAWYIRDVADLLPDAYKDRAPNLRKGTDTMDVWFDSGSSWSGVLGLRQGLEHPADLYLEGSDQHRGWFQSSLLTSVASEGVAPYKSVLTHGFVLDEKGMKMSKSVGNVVDPRKVILGGNNQKTEPAFGADVLRLWVASVDYTSDVLIGDRIIGQVADVYRKIRFTLRYILGNLSDFDPKKDEVAYDDLPSTDKFILNKFVNLMDECKSSYENYQFYRVYQAMQRFVVLDLSNFYLDVIKDRLYVSEPDSRDRRACQTVLNHLLKGILSIIAPLTPHMAEDAWQNIPYETSEMSVFLNGWNDPQEAWSVDAHTENTWKSILAIRDEVNQQLEKARVEKLLGSSLEASIILHVEDDALRQALENLQNSNNGQDALRYSLITSSVELVSDASAAQNAEYSSSGSLEGSFKGSFTVGVNKAGGLKCSRCWNYSKRVGEDSEHGELCERCYPVIRKSGFKIEPVLSAAAQT
jgi:isoleucyl-tRNA synthetase